MTNQERYEEDLKIIPKGGSKAYVIDGFNACIRRHGYIGHLCGYVEVPDGLSVNIDEIDCHGDITFNGHWSEFPNRRLLYRFRLHARRRLGPTLS